VAAFWRAYCGVRKGLAEDFLNVPPCAARGVECWVTRELSGDDSVPIAVHHGHRNVAALEVLEHGGPVAQGQPHWRSPFTELAKATSDSGATRPARTSPRETERGGYTLSPGWTASASRGRQADSRDGLAAARPTPHWVTILRCGSPYFTTRSTAEGGG
jgi:hypothetical protein